ncbi:RING finger domain-containing protein [Cardinium endosymbiont of Philonthus spinipes]|uniref:RING finger domain-containing protein n=1 Tax=Cardinium endosymbiont of Philonthus spinipes TaxID=3077941 RepID=UPI00313B77FC
MSLMYNHPDRDKADRERLKTETVNRALLLSLNELRSSDYRGLARCPDNLLSGTIKFLLSSDDRNVSFPDLPKNAELLQKSAALEYLIKALKEYPKNCISEGWLNGIKCAIDHEHVELFQYLLDIAIGNERNACSIEEAYNYLKTKNNPKMIAYIEERVCFIYRDNIKPLPSDTQEICAICHADSEKNNKLFPLKCTCKYYYHKECIREWIKVSSSCPFCKVKLEYERLFFSNFLQ